MSAQTPRPPAPEEPPTAVGVPRHAPPVPADGLRPREPLPPAYGEPLPPEDPRWREAGWLSAALAALAGLVVGGVIGLIAGKSSATTTTTTLGGAAHTVTVRGPARTKTVRVPHVIVRTQTVTTASPAGGEGAEGTAGSGLTYTGNGSGRIGTLNISRESTLHWRTSGESFSVKNSSEDERSLDFTSHSASGERPVEAGTYHEVNVSSPGTWTLTISPG
jgi:hypothetical protein